MIEKIVAGFFQEKETTMAKGSSGKQSGRSGASREGTALRERTEELNKQPTKEEMDLYKELFKSPSNDAGKTNVLQTRENTPLQEGNGQSEVRKRQREGEHPEDRGDAKRRRLEDDDERKNGERSERGEDKENQDPFLQEMKKQIDLRTQVDKAKQEKQDTDKQKQDTDKQKQDADKQREDADKQREERRDQREKELDERQRRRDRQQIFASALGQSVQGFANGAPSPQIDAANK
jgi:hypothetical protein